MKGLETYRTLSENSPTSIFKEKGSKFIGYAFPVSDEATIKACIATVKKEHHTARHWCYAWRMGTDPYQFRVNDDGEPSNSAGQPIYGQILASDLTNVLIVVVRYFGGVKLGVGGLIRAYKESAQLTLANAEKVDKEIQYMLELTFDYAHMNKIMRIIKQKNLSIKSQNLSNKCNLILNVNKGHFTEVKNLFKKHHFLVLKSS
ncbi:MAG: IMPACT family protein [Flavicella sp.]